MTAVYRQELEAAIRKHFDGILAPHEDHLPEDDWAIVAQIAGTFTQKIVGRIDRAAWVLEATCKGMEMPK